MECYIRFADYNDSKILGEIHSQSWKVAYKDIVPDEILDNISAEKREKYFKKVISEKSQENALIFYENNPAGFLTLGKCRDENSDSSWGETWGIYLLPAYWNQGIGTELINWGINKLENRGYKKISLWVLEENTNARNFYEKIGFKLDGTIKELNIGKPLNEYRYVKTIA